MNFESKFKEERVANIEEKVEKVESKIMFVKELHSLALSLDSNDNIDCKQLQALLWDKFTIYIESDEDIRSGFNQIKNERELKVALVAENERYKLLSSKEKEEVRDAHRVFVDEKNSEILNINLDQGVKYVKQIIDYIDYLTDLRKERDFYKDLYTQDGGNLHKDGKFVIAINKFINNIYANYRQHAQQNNTLGKSANLGRANYGNYLNRVEFRGLGVGLIFDPRIQGRLRDFNDVAGKSWGCVSFRYDNNKDELVHNHEYGHTLYGKHVADVHLYSDKFIRQIDQIVNNSRPEEVLARIFGNLPDSTNNTGNSKEEKLQSLVLGYHKKLMSEIFADIPNIFNHQLADGFWGHFRESMRNLAKYIDQLKNEPLKKILITSKAQLVKTVEIYMNNMAKLVYIAKKLDMTDDIIAGLLVFSGDTRKELRHVENKIGEETFAALMTTFDPYKNKICRSTSELHVKKIIDNIPPTEEENALQSTVIKN